MPISIQEHAGKVRCTAYLKGSQRYSVEIDKLPEKTQTAVKAALQAVSEHAEAQIAEQNKGAPVEGLRELGGERGRALREKRAARRAEHSKAREARRAERKAKQDKQRAAKPAAAERKPRGK
jgi:hypothetical protein